MAPKPKTESNYSPDQRFSIVTITSETVLGEWWGKQVLDIEDLHQK